MSKLGESVIQGAIEALEIAKRKDSGAEAKTSASPDLPEAPKPVIKKTEKTEIE